MEKVEKKKNSNRRGSFFGRPKPEFDQKILNIRRVTRVVAGGRRFSFSIALVVGDKKGKVGVALGKASDVASAIRKGMKRARKNMITVAMKGLTIPHVVQIKKGAALVLLKPAPDGTGVRAGGAVRAVVEAAGIQNIVSKILGTRNKISNATAVIEGLKKLKQNKAHV